MEGKVVGDAMKLLALAMVELSLSRAKRMFAFTAEDKSMSAFGRKPASMAV